MHQLSLLSNLGEILRKIHGISNVINYWTLFIKDKVFSWPGASHWRIYYHRMWGQLSTTCSNATEVAQLGTPSCKGAERVYNI